MTTPNMTCSENNPDVLKTQPIRDEKKISEENWANQKWTKVGYAIFFQEVDKKCHEKIEWIFVTKAWLGQTIRPILMKIWSCYKIG